MATSTVTRDRSLQDLLPQPTVALATVGCSAIAGAAVCISGARGGAAGSDWALAGLLGITTVLSYRYPIHARTQTKVYFFTMLFFLSAVLLPPLMAVVTVAAGALAGELSRRRVSGCLPSDIATEVGRRVLITVPVSMIAHAGLGAANAPEILIAAAITMALFDAFTLPLVLSPISGEPPHQVILETLRATALPEAVQYCLAIVGAAAASHALWLLVCLFPPSALAFSELRSRSEVRESTRHLLVDMADAVDLRDAYTGGHSRRVTEYAAALLAELGMHGPEVDLVLAAARVHDIGKIGIPDTILHNHGPLSPAEWEVMKQHPVTGAALLKRHHDFRRGIDIVRHHHERWDGGGYPDGRKGTDIPFGARVIAVTDSFDAMTSNRPYRAGMTVQEALAILEQGRGTQWDAALVDAFMRTRQRAAPLSTQQHLPPTVPAP